MQVPRAERLASMTQPKSISTGTSIFMTQSMTLTTPVELTILSLRTLIYHRLSKFHFLRRTSSLQRREISSEIGSSRSTWTAQSVNPFQPEGASTVAARSTSALLTANTARLSGSHASSLGCLWSRPTPSTARFAARVPFGSIGTTTSKQPCTALGARACRPNTDVYRFYIDVHPYNLVPYID